jgi:preprotein translocase subunit YajC
VSAPILSNELLLAQNAQPKGGSPGVVQDATPGPLGGGSSASSAPSSPLAGFTPMLVMLVIIVPFWLMMSRRTKKETQARAALKRGDRVMSNAGLIGELVEMDDRIAKVKLSPSVTVQMVANTVSPYVEVERAGAKDLKEAKAGSDKK